MRLPLLLAGLLSSAALADPAPFDLTGPTVEVSATRGGATLPIAEVPQLAVGDTLSIRADLPADQSAHYLLVAAFLRGSTNPPPDKWFFQSETWTKKGRDGLKVTVPEGAEQVVLFLAPATGGDFPTLRNAVQGKPGAFVRSTQDLNQASLDRSRLDAYLNVIRQPSSDPERLATVTPLLARSLSVKINTECLQKMPELQAACLLQNQESLVLNDGHSNAIAEAVAGPGVDLALQLSATPQAGLGYYSPYIAAIRDIIGILGSLHTAKYQYIPALARQDGTKLALILNTPPSFHNPKSVLIAALPGIAPPHVPPLQAVEQVAPLCAQSRELVLPISGAPLVYSTAYAHDMAARITLGGGRTIDLPATPDAEKGGFVVSTEGKLPADLGATVDATLHGQWGFAPFDGPRFHLQAARPGQWHVDGGAAPVVGRDATVTLTGGAAACVASVAMKTGGGDPQPVQWKATKPGEITATLPLSGAKPGALSLLVAAQGGREADTIALTSTAQARFSATLIAKNLDRPAATTPIAITLSGEDDVPSDARLRFSLRADGGAGFTGKETVEVQAGSGATATLAPPADLTLQDAHVALATLDPARALGPSAYGPLRFRLVRDGTAGDWQPLGTLVRLPGLQQLHCPADPAATCELSGDRLFLIASVAATPDFAKPTDIPSGYPGTATQVPHPADGSLYVRLRDDPAVTSRITN